MSEQLTCTRAQAEAAEKALAQAVLARLPKGSSGAARSGSAPPRPNPRYPYSPHTMGWAVGCASAWLAVVTETRWATTISLL